MFTNPYASAQLASDRQRDLLAQAQQHRLASQFRGRPRAARPVAPPRRGWYRALRAIAVGGTAMPA